MSSITDSDYEHWQQHGYVIVPLLSEQEVAATLADIDEYMPTWEEYVRRPRWFGQTVSSPVRGPGQGAEFPTPGTPSTTQPSTPIMSRSPSG